MDTTIEIKTDRSIFDFATIFKDTDDIEILGEFDSANYGIGYDLKVRNAECRLFDDLISRDDNDPSLYLEIDRYDKIRPDKKVEIFDYLKSIIIRHDFKVL